MNRKDEALKTFNKSFNCSQAVISVFCEEFGLDKKTALKIATGFGGGISNGEVCGAVTGAIMALGLKEGHDVEEDIETKNKAYSLTSQFVNRFQERNKSIVCKELLGHDLSVEEEYALMIEKGLFNSVCPKAIIDAVDILEDILELNN